MTDRVHPSRDDALVRSLSEVAGGPLGDHAGRHPWWTPLRVVLLLATLSLSLGMVAKAPCLDVAGEGGTGRYAALCWSDVSQAYVDRGHAELAWPFTDDPAVRERYAAGWHPPVPAYVAWAAARVTHVVSGSPDLDERRSEAVADVAVDEDVHREARIFTAVTAIWLAAAGLLAAGLLVGVRRRRPWDAAAFAAAPVLVLLWPVTWDLLAAPPSPACCGAGPGAGPGWPVPRWGWARPPHRWSRCCWCRWSWSPCASGAAARRGGWRPWPWAPGWSPTPRRTSRRRRPGARRGRATCTAPTSARCGCWSSRPATPTSPAPRCSPPPPCWSRPGCGVVAAVGLRTRLPLAALGTLAVAGTLVVEPGVGPVVRPGPAAAGRARRGALARPAGVAGGRGAALRDARAGTSAGSSPRPAAATRGPTGGACSARLLGLALAGHGRAAAGPDGRLR